MFHRTPTSSPPHQGIVTNPRTYSLAHMADNLGAYTGLALSPAEVAALSARPQGERQ